MSRQSVNRISSEVTWFKSSYSDSSDGSECVEVAAAPGAVLVRDSKNIAGPRLGFAPNAWGDFVSHASES